MRAPVSDRPHAEPGTDNGRRLGAVRTAFDAAWAALLPAQRVVIDCHLAGAPACIRIAGKLFAERVAAALLPPGARTDGSATPHLRIDLWDACETGIDPPAANHVEGRRWELLDGVFAASPDGRLVSHEQRGSITWVDRGAQHLTGWCGDARALSLHQRAKPLQVPLALCANDRGLQPVHAGGVARQGRGVLIPGASGSGKSTVALACLGAGYDYLGDDWIGIGRAPSDAFTAHALYTSALLDPAHAARFPNLQQHAVAPADPCDPKSLVLLAPLFPARMGRSAMLTALVLPRIVGGAGAACRPASRAEALRILAPSSIFTMRPRSGREGFERIAAVVEHLPAYWLEIGSRLDDIPQHIDEILDRVAPP